MAPKLRQLEELLRPIIKLKSDCDNYFTDIALKIAKDRMETGEWIKTRIKMFNNSYNLIQTKCSEVDDRMAISIRSPWEREEVVETPEGSQEL